MMIYTFMTWVIANLLHPLAMMACWGFISSGLISGGIMETYFFLLIISFLFSLPSLIISSVAVHIPLRLPINATQKYFLWVLIASVIPLLNLFVLNLLDRSLFHEFDFDFIIPASISALAAVLIRYKQFFNLLQKQNVKENSNV